MHENFSAFADRDSMDFAEAVRYLYGLGHEVLAMKLGLENVARLLGALGQPHRQFPSVQIAGTNGKGSVAAMLEAICRAAGIKTGLYTSPHLVSITERIRLGGEEIAPDEFAQQAARVRAAAESVARETGVRPTFFEQVTAIALCAFSQAQVQLAVLETGLGGRLDATTAAGAQTVALTPIDFDHQEHLGSTLEEIAAEKAAIIRPETQSVVVAPQPIAAMRVIQERARACGVIPRVVRDDFTVVGAFDVGRLRVTFATESDRYEDARLSLRGRHQITNAAVAIALAEALRERGFAISRRAIVRGLETAEHAGRLELIEARPKILLDGAHNVASARALRAFLDEFVAPPITLVFGAMRDKEIAAMADLLFPVAQSLVLTRPMNPRAATIKSLIAALPQSCDRHCVETAPSASEALKIARASTPDHGLICVTGSLYLVGEVRALIKGTVGSPGGACGAVEV